MTTIKVTISIVIIIINITIIIIVKRDKLGIKHFDCSLWEELLSLLKTSRADYTIFFRQLSLASDCVNGQDAFLKIQHAFPKEVNDTFGWIKWFDKYIDNMKADKIVPSERKKLMNLVNPKFIPRQWMLTKAYEEAAKKDFTLIKEIHELLCHPYDDQSDEVTKKYFRTTPDWAKEMPGTAYLN